MKAGPFAKFLLILSVLVSAFGCQTPKQTAEPVVQLTPPRAEPAPTASNPGSLFNPNDADYLFADNRARRIGDVVLVNIVESSKAGHKAETDSGRDSNVEIGIEELFGKSHTRLLPIGPSFGMKGEVGETPMVKAGSSSDFSGDGETSRESTFSATVAARVTDILPGGLLQLEGAREMKINNENQILVVRGLARKRDIRPDNSITSTYLADAKIEYYGRGILADKQKPGWLARILDNITPF
jgi:flagellar L-ring protein precursor FlgH